MKRIRMILLWSKKYHYLLVIAMIGLLGVTAMNLIAPWFLRDLITLISGDNYSKDSLPQVYRIAVILGASYLLRVVFRFCYQYFAHVAAWRAVADLRVRVYDHLQKLSLRYYHDKQTGQLMSRTVNDTGILEELIAHSVPELITNVLILAGVTVLLMIINVKLTLLTMIPIPFIFAGSIWFTKKVRPIFRSAQEALADMNATLQDNFSGVKEIQVFNQHDREKARINAKAQTHADMLLVALRRSAFFHPTMEFVTSMGTVIVVLFGSVLALNSGLTIADIVAFILYLGMFYAPVQALARLSEGLGQSLAGLDRVFEVLDQVPDVKTMPEAKTFPVGRGEVTLNHVDFSYQDDSPVLTDVSMQINPGEMVALVGPTGVGKTTLISLLARFYDPISGSVSFDGHDIREYTLESLRSQFSIVLQDVFLFHGTIADNITYGLENATREQIEEAAKIANIHEFILSLPEGYNTYIGERGVRLSGGQKQRVSIARAILRGSPLLILDEATSSVDVETEREIQGALQALAGSRTLLVIAHRLSTIRRADKIYVLESGRIVQSGKHEDLMKDENGTYARLVSSITL